MENTILIRQMLTDDAAYVARFHHAAWMDAYRNLLPKEGLDRITLRHFQQSWKQILQETERINLVAIEKAMPVGYASYVPLKKPGRWELVGLYVHPRSMNKGCGSALFGAVLEDIRAQDANQLIVWVMDGNQRAIQFYQKHGMSFSGKTRETTQEGMTFKEIQLELRFESTRPS